MGHIWNPDRSSAAVGTVTGASNEGAGQNVYDTVNSTSTNLVFKSLTSTGSSLTFTNTATTVNGEIADATLIALAAYNTNGLVTQTAADTFTGRTITGTASQIAVSNGNGVSGNPTLSLPSQVILPTNAAACSISLLEASANGTNKVTVVAPDNIASDWTLTLPTSGGTNNYVLSTNGSGATSWVAQSGGGGVSRGPIYPMMIALLSN